jgi:uncharacterized membrane protein
MNKEWNFIKTTIIGGLLVILPTVAVLAVMGFIMWSTVNLVSPLVGKLPIDTVGGFIWAAVLTVFLLLAISFSAGLFVQMQIGQLTQQRVESFLLKQVPGYHMFRNLTRQLVGQEGLEFAPALVDLQGTGALVLGLIVEEHAEGYFTVFVPNSPTVTLGRVYFLPGDRIKRVGASLVDVMNCLTQWGMESKDLFSLSLKTS